MYSTKGYNPKAGILIKTAGVVVTGSNNRIFYVRPSPDSAGINKVFPPISNQIMLLINFILSSQWTSLNFTVSNGKEISRDGTITIVPLSGALVGSDFLLSSENWVIVGNKEISSTATFEAFSRGPKLNRYIYATDNKINRMNPSSGSPDMSLWYFSAPSRFLGNQGIAYGGTISFTLAAFSGDFSQQNGANVCCIEITWCFNPAFIALVFAKSLL